MDDRSGTWKEEEKVGRRNEKEKMMKGGRSRGRTDEERGRRTKLKLTEESSALPSIKDPMIVSECDDHDRSDEDLAINDDCLVFDGVHSWR
jgi:hypothetical protein